MSKDKNAKKAVRKKRVPLGVSRLKMAVDKRPGYKRRWVNDTGGRIQQALDGGYNLVSRDDAEFKDEDVMNINESLNNSVCKTVNSDGSKAYLMEISNSLYESDQLAKAKQIDEVEMDLQEGADAHGKQGVEGRYVPEEGIKISR